MEIDEIMALLARVRTGTAVVAKAQYSPDPGKAERTLVFTEKGQRLIKLADAWLAPKTYNELITRLPDASPGACSAMYNTNPSYVWATRKKELHLWQRGSLVARFASQESHVKGSIIGMWSTYRNATIAFVHAFLSRSWVHRGVRLECAEGRNLVIAKSLEAMAIIDPTYDGLDVMCDAAWVGELASAIASATGVPLKMDKELS